MTDNYSTERQDLLLWTALDYAQRRQWPVIPLHNPRGDGCSCNKDCGSPGKHPRTENGLHEASTDEGQIRAWWQRWPSANIGLRTGIAFDVIDIDSEEALNALVAAQVGEWVFGPKTRTAKGWHLLVAPSGRGNRTGIIPGVDYRGRNGYIVAPPSSHVTGSVYEWGPASISTPIEPAPDWFVKLLNPERPAVRATPVPVRGTAAYARKALKDELEILASAIEGGRNDQLNRSAFNLGQLVGAHQLEADDVARSLLDVALAIGLGESESIGTINSGLTKGIAAPRATGQTIA